MAEKTKNTTIVEKVNNVTSVEKVKDTKNAKSKEKSVFDILNAIDVSNKVKDKNNLSYLPWASAWAEVKKVYPDATYQIYEECFGENVKPKIWFDDGKTGWVKVGVTIKGQEYTEILPIMNHRNQCISSDQITSADANKSIKRCLVKACALHGLGLYIYEGEDLPEEISNTIKLKQEIFELISKKVELSEKAKEKVKELCKAAEKSANPDVDEKEIKGEYRDIEDVEILENLKKQLLAVRK